MHNPPNLVILGRVQSASVCSHTDKLTQKRQTLSAIQVTFQKIEQEVSFCPLIHRPTDRREHRTLQIHCEVLAGDEASLSESLDGRGNDWPLPVAKRC